MKMMPPYLVPLRIYLSSLSSAIYTPGLSEGHPLSSLYCAAYVLNCFLVCLRKRKKHTYCDLPHSRVRFTHVITRESRGK